MKNRDLIICISAPICIVAALATIIIHFEPNELTRTEVENFSMAAFENTEAIINKLGLNVMCRNTVEYGGYYVHRYCSGVTKADVPVKITCTYSNINPGINGCDVSGGIE